jgi:predicted NBD/HSP70 family sugar kinase
MSADAAAPRLWLGLDLGATNAKVALVSDAGVVLTTHALQLSSDDRSPAAVVDMLLTCCQACLQAHKPPVPFSAISAIGVGCPGKCNPNGTVEGIANFPWPPNTPLAQLIGARTGRPVFLTNDAAAVVAAENWVGIGKRVKNFAVLTLGSGVGCGIFNDGVLLQGCSGTIEGGHMIVQADGGRPCGCGSRGCLEAYVSANSVAKLATEALDEEDAANPARGEEGEVAGGGDGGEGGVALPRSSLHVLRRSKQQGAVTAKSVFAAAAGGDALALSVVDRVARVLAVGCINLSRVRASFSCSRACVGTWV